MNRDKTIRNHLVALLDWHESHIDFDDAVADFPDELIGVRPQGLPYSAWELLEHMRLCQVDILDFCRNPDYREPTWPDDYWPGKDKKPSRADWERATKAFKRDLDELKQLCVDQAIDLIDKIPHGDGQTYLREFLLVADHNAYHLGQLLAVRRLLGV